MCNQTRTIIVSVWVLAATCFWSEPADAMPAFARQYGVSCNVCHAAYPRLNEFGETFAGDMNFRLTGVKTLFKPAMRRSHYPSHCHWHYAFKPSFRVVRARLSTRFQAK